MYSYTIKAFVAPPTRVQGNECVCLDVGNVRGSSHEGGRWPICAFEDVDGICGLPRGGGCDMFTCMGKVFMASSTAQGKIYMRTCVYMESVNGSQ